MGNRQTQRRAQAGIVVFVACYTLQMGLKRISFAFGRNAMVQLPELRNHRCLSVTDALC